MAGLRSTLLAALPPLLWAAAAVAQPSLDCSKAATAAEKAICANPGLAAADAAMAQAFAALLKAAPAAQQTALKADQKSWLIDRDGGCFDQKDDALVQCLLAATETRRHFLVGEGDNGPAGASALLPVYFTDSRKNLYQITIAYPQFAAPAGAKFNAAMRDLAVDKKTLAEYRESTPGTAAADGNYYQVGYDITYLAPNLAAVTFQFGGFAGGAHPNNWRIAVLWNPAADKPVALDDFLADPAAAVPAISALCKDKLTVLAKKDGWDFLDDPDFNSVVKDTKSWAVDKDGVTVDFDPYAVTPYVVGPLQCRLSYAELANWLKPGGPLPPR